MSEPNQPLAILFGASGTIGRAIHQRLHEQGWLVAAHSGRHPCGELPVVHH